MTSFRILNGLWSWQCRHASNEFTVATRRVADAQMKVLREILQVGKNAAYGRQFNFSKIRNAQEYQRRAPTMTYQELQPWIERAAAGERQVLTDEPIRLFQPTGGSSGGEKLIPYTPLLQKQFQRGIQAWIRNLYTGVSGVRKGPAYWSISPAAQEPRQTTGGIDIGFENDVEYLSPMMRRVVSHLLAVPGEVARLRDVEDFRYATVCYLLTCEHLALLSVWSPTFLVALLANLDPWLDSICRDLHCGWIKLPVAGERLILSGRRHRTRAKQLAAIFEAHSELPDRLAAAWPKLAMISCWGDAASALFLPQLRELFPEVAIQPKGLLATEGIVSFPIVGRQGAALAINSHFFEFAPHGDSEDASSGDSPRSNAKLADRPALAHELERGAKYKVLLTTGGGLYRYQLGDVVEVSDFLDGCPLVRFVGRVSGVCDLVGEKLAESHVRGVLDEVFADLQLTPRFALLAPNGGRGYRLFLECDSVDRDTRRRLGKRIELGLQRNPHYAHAVRIQQLEPVEVVTLAGAEGVGWRIFQRALRAEGQRAGDIKPVACDSRRNWSDAFREAIADEQHLVRRRLLQDQTSS